MNKLAKLGGVTLACAMVFLAGCNEDKEESNKIAATVEVQPVAETQPAVTAEPAVDVAVEVVETTGDEKPFLATTSEVVVTASVKAINQDTRVVTLVGQEGEEHTVLVSDEARNLDQVEVGDELTITYFQNVTIEVVDGQGVEAAQGSIVAAVRAEEGQKPGAAMGETNIAVLKVEAINIEANTFKLKDANGMVKEFKAMNPENLKRSSVGDAVIISTTQTVAVKVVETPKG